MATIEDYQEYIADLRNKYGQLNTYWELRKLQQYNKDPKMFAAHTKFVELLKKDVE